MVNGEKRNLFKRFESFFLIGACCGALISMGITLGWKRIIHFSSFLFFLLVVFMAIFFPLIVLSSSTSQRILRTRHPELVYTLVPLLSFVYTFVMLTILGVCSLLQIIIFLFYLSW
jgi:hypothetical protein